MSGNCPVSKEMFIRYVKGTKVSNATDFNKLDCNMHFIQTAQFLVRAVCMKCMYRKTVNYIEFATKIH